MSDELSLAIKQDDGLKQLIEMVQEMQYGTGQLSYKKHKGRIGQINLSEARSHRIAGWTGLLGYLAEMGKWYKDNHGNQRCKITFTLDIDNKGEVDRLTEDIYKTKYFSTPI